MIFSAALLEQKRRLLWSAIIYTAFFFSWLIYINITQQQNSGLKMSVGIPFYFICLFFLIFRYYKMRDLLLQHHQHLYRSSDSSGDISFLGQDSDIFDESVLAELGMRAEPQNESLIREIERNGPPSYKDLTEAPSQDPSAASPSLPPAYAFASNVVVTPPPPSYNEVFSQPLPESSTGTTSLPPSIASSSSSSPSPV